MPIHKALTSTILTSGGGSGGGIAVGHIADRPSSPSIGMLFYNTDYDTLEQYTRSGWQKTTYQVAMALRMNNMELM